MKRIFFIFSTLTIIAACGNNNTQNETTETTTENQDPEIQRGLELVAKNGCFTCHKVDEASTGPAYTLVAAKYQPTQAVIDTLVQKVIKGGSGNWGAVPMIPHPDIPPADVEAMVKYVLSLKK